MRDLNMLNTPGKLPVRTRLPLAAWAVAAVVTFASLMSSLWQAHHPVDHVMPSAEHHIMAKPLVQQAKL
jgi:hypothetical protein